MRKDEAAPARKLSAFVLHPPAFIPISWSGRRDLNSRPSPWQGDALPLSYSRLSTVDSNDSTVLAKRCPHPHATTTPTPTRNKRCNAKGDHPITLHRCLNPKPHAGTDAQPSGLCFAV